MNMVSNNFLSDNHDVSLILSRGIPDIWVGVLYFLSGERFENLAKLNLPHPFQEGTETLNHFDILTFGATDKFKVIPHSPDMFQPFAADVNSDVINFHSSRDVHGFGYDMRTHDFKVISHVSFRAPRLNPRKGFVALGDTSIERFWEIYSLRSNSWRKLDVVMPTTTYGNGITMGVYLNGLCHWGCIIGHFHSKRESNLVSFDLSNDVFFTTPIPMDIDRCINVDNKCSWRDLAVLNGSIALITYQEQMATFNISILSELTVKESWIKLFIVGPLSCVERPFGVGKGKIFFKKKVKKLAWFDLSTQMIEDLDVKGGDSRGYRIVVYKENLLPIGGINK
ncbi:F-box protein interaction domain protein [Medicago truncatula]|uniref:F-box protein interaction domain protein n=1 Tax=Medicago truncatula TaxID=3880 RepID=G7KFQ7_MEDTR|nr:F-box protein interaction domain protein [Medicago truncatula]